MVCTAHEEAIVKWKAICKMLKGHGVVTKNLPKKPKHVLKASLVEESEDGDEGSGSDEESESDDD